MNRIPHGLAILRLLLGIALPLFAVLAIPPSFLAVLFLVGFLSDIFDGVIARRMGVATLSLRRLDSRCDIVFFVGAVWAVFIISPITPPEWIFWIGAYATLFLIRNLIDYIRYRASPSYHMWSGKVWALMMGTYFFFSFLGFDSSFLLPLAFLIYMVNAFEGITASLILPTPRSDIPTLWHVLHIHRQAPEKGLDPDSRH